MSDKPEMRIKIPHEEYAKRLIYEKLGYAEKNITRQECFELMLAFGELEKRMCDHWKQIAEDYAANKLPSFIVPISEHGTGLCADCARPKNDLNFHFDAPGANHASGLHWFKIKQEQAMSEPINTVYRLIQVLSTFRPDMEVLIKPSGAMKFGDMGWIEKVGAEKHEGEWFAVIHIEEISHE